MNSPFPPLRTRARREVHARQFRFKGLRCHLMGETAPKYLRRGSVFVVKADMRYADRTIPAGTRVKFLGFTKPTVMHQWASQYRAFQFAAEDWIRFLQPDDIRRPN